MFNLNDVYEEGGLFLCTFVTQSENYAKNYCDKHESIIQGIAGSVKLTNEGNKVIISTSNKNLTAYVAKLLNGYVKKVF